MCLLSGLIAIFFYLYRSRLSSNRDRCSRFDFDIYHRRPKKITYGFFHPFASGGGGGERVLWKMIQFLQSQKSQHCQLRQRQRNQNGDKTYSENNTNNHDQEDEDDVIEIFIYTIDPPSTNEADLRLDAERRFDVKIPQPVRLVSLEQYKEYLSPRPFLSLVMESWGTMKLARQALLIQQQQCVEKQQKESEFIFCDTTGCAFTFVVVRLMCISTTTRILAYVHYPTISIDMMFWEWQQNNNNSNSSIKKRIKTVVKLIYYYLFSLMYGLCGSLADLVLVNSTWTYNHINSLWRFRGGGGIISTHPRQQPICIVYPPCRVPSTVDDNNNNEQQQLGPGTLRENTIISIGQFRPEKNHKLQIQALFILLKNHPELRKTTTKTATTMTMTKKKIIIVIRSYNRSCKTVIDRQLPK